VPNRTEWDDGGVGDTPSGGFPVSNRVMTIPNLVSVLRLGAIPLFLWLVWRGDDLIGLIVLVLAVSTDFVDGALARRLGQVSALGQLLDPLADRLFIAAVVVALTIRDVVPLWVVLLVLGRDVLLGLGTLIFRRFGVGVLPVKWMGKWATFALLFSLPLFLLVSVFEGVSIYVSPFAWAVAIAGVVLYWWAGILYLLDAVGIARTAGARGSGESATLSSTTEG
jgi:cardiolipin synthase (CMP-forming)